MGQVLLGFEVITGLPMVGNALRHTFKTLHVGLGISETLSHFLMGHALKGVSPEYIAEIVRGPAIRAAQEKIGAHVLELLGLKHGPIPGSSAGRPSASGRHHDAPLVPDAPTNKSRKAATHAPSA